MRIEQHRKDSMDVSDVPPLPAMPDRQDVQCVEAELDQVRQRHDAAIAKCAATSKKSGCVYKANLAAMEEHLVAHPNDIEGLKVLHRAVRESGDAHFTNKDRETEILRSALRSSRAESDHLRQDVCELIDRLASLHAQLERANKDYRREWVKCRVQKPMEQQTRQSRNRMSKKLHNMLVRFCGSDKNVREALCDMLKRYRDIGSAVIDTTALEKKLHTKIVAEMELSVEEALSLV